MIINNINSEVINEVKSKTKMSDFKRGNDIVMSKKAILTKFDIVDDFTFSFAANVMDGSENYRVEVEVDNGNFIERKCNCDDFARNEQKNCAHIAAGIIAFDKDKEVAKKALEEDEDFEEAKEPEEHKPIGIKKVTNDMKYKEAFHLLKIFSPEETAKRADKRHIGKIKITPKLEYNKAENVFASTFWVSSIVDGIEYKIKSIDDFYNDMVNGRYQIYGSLSFTHRMEMFEPRSKKLAQLILDFGRIFHSLNTETDTTCKDLVHKYKSQHKDDIELKGALLDSFFEAMIGETVEVKGISSAPEVEISDEKPPISFRIEKTRKDEYKLCGSYNKNSIHMQGEKYFYFIKDGVIYRCENKQYEDIFKVVSVLDEKPNREIFFDKENLPGVFSFIVPRIRDNFDFSTVKNTELEYYMPAPLAVKVMLDSNKFNDVEAKVLFSYNDKEFNPFDGEEHFDVTRSFKDEMDVKDFFSETGFIVNEDKGLMTLHGDDTIYDFLTNGILTYMKKFEVLASDDFSKKQIVKTKISSANVKIDNNLLEFEFDKLGYSTSELKAILEGYVEKKKFVRLKDGSFLDLDEDDELQFLSNLTKGMDEPIEDVVKDLQNGRLVLPAYRSMYLNSILEKLNSTNITKDKTFKMVTESLDDPTVAAYKVPKNLEDVLRVYQKEGFKWLSVLDDYKFGGILADDMGLGKTIQIISLVESYLEKNKEGRKTSIVICPSSLTLNWKNEFAKFAPKVKVFAFSGNQEYRKKVFKEIKDYDVVITSYDLLKRDIEEYENLKYTFKYIVADEAQYIKNASTKNSKALKTLKGETRFALTGTPIENALSELWSIFDFIMPDYLYNYGKFKRTYELPIVKEDNVYARESLKKQIAPFILRRLKKDVLTELPDKTITIINNEMNQDQRKAYAAYLQSANEEVLSEIGAKGIERSQIKILAILTRLRQICCHPSLFIDNYKGESSKFNQCLEIMKDSIESGHKILLFSQFTSMFEHFEKELSEMEYYENGELKKGIKYFVLTGQTKTDERIRLVDEFNENSDVKVFLISLKAGGTGLNLTGADVVMHYDPWWNLSAENQATDRAYRIGQKNNVQVYKFITENSIEEKINELQEKKAKLSEGVLSLEESLISSLSKSEIMKLFE